MRIAIIGAGMAGSACAEALVHAGHEVVVLDKGRGPGGRMSTRRLETAAGTARFDHGAQYFTARDMDFRARVAAWTAAGVVARWPAAGHDAYVGVPAMNAPIRAMAEEQIARGEAVRWATRVTALEQRDAGWRLHVDAADDIDVDAAVVAVPAEQAAALLAPVAPRIAAHADAVPSAPCWTLMLAFAAPVPVTQDCWRSRDIIAWAARNSAKPGRDGPESWVVQASPAWSRTHLEADPTWVATVLKEAFAAVLGVHLPSLVGEASHRWRFALSGVEGLRADGSGAIWDSARRLGVCGDWLIAPRVEAAWLSGKALAARITAGAD